MVHPLDLVLGPMSQLTDKFCWIIKIDCFFVYLGLLLVLENK